MAPLNPLLAVPNVTAHPKHPSTASVPTSYYSMWHRSSRCPLKVQQQLTMYEPLPDGSMDSSSSIGLCDVYVGGKVRVSEFMILLDLQHCGSK